MIDFARMRWLINNCPRLKWDVERKEANATKITTNLTGMPHGGNSTREDTYIALSEVREAYHEVYTELEEMRKALAPLIDGLESPHERGAMRLRYMEGHKPQDVAEGLGFTERWVFRLLKKAERKINEQKPKKVSTDH